MAPTGPGIAVSDPAHDKMSGGVRRTRSRNVSSRILRIIAGSKRALSFRAAVSFSFSSGYLSHERNEMFRMG